MAWPTHLKNKFCYPCSNYKLGYMPNCKFHCAQMNNLPFGCKSKECCPTGCVKNYTVQQLSYQPYCCVARRKPIRPISHLTLPVGRCESNAEFHLPIRCRNNCTVTQLSYQPHCCMPRRRPIRPLNNLTTVPHGYMYRC